MSDAAAVETASNETSMPEIPSSTEQAPRDDVQEAIAIMSGDSDDSNDTGRVSKTDGQENGNNTGDSKQSGTDTSDTKSTQPKHSAWASLHKKQVEFQQQRDAFNKEKAEIEKVKSLIENAKTDRLSALEALGYTDVKAFVEGLVEDGGRMTPERKKVLELEKKIADREQREAEEVQTRQQQERASQQRAQLDALHNQVVQNIKEHHADSLASIDGSSQAVMQEMDRLAGENGVMPDIAEAIKNVSTNYEKNFRTILENPRARAIAQEILASSKISPASRPKASINTIGSSAQAVTSPPKSKGAYDPNDEVEQMVKWINSQK
jgi:hypothetical protein